MSQMLLRTSFPATDGNSDTVSCNTSEAKGAADDDVADGKSQRKYAPDLCKIVQVTRIDTATEWLLSPQLGGFRRHTKAFQVLKWYQKIVSS